MRVIIHRGTKEIGGTLIEMAAKSSRILIDAGYPLFLNGEPIDSGIAGLPHERLLELGVLPNVRGLYQWDTPAFNAVIISHAHLDHYGLLQYVHPDIPVFMSAGTRMLIELSQRFGIAEAYPLNADVFTMYRPFNIKDFNIKPYLMDHSAFDAAAFEIMAEGKTVIYTGDFRGHGRKAICLERFIAGAGRQADALFVEGTMLGRPGEAVPTEAELEDAVVKYIKGSCGPVLFQSSSQNTDRIVSFYRAAQRCKKTFVIDIYTANVLYALRQLGNHLPYPSQDYPDIRVFYPRRLTQKIFDELGGEPATRFSAFHLSRERIGAQQGNIVMLVRPSMQPDIERCGLRDGIFIYSLWQGYRQSAPQQRFESYLLSMGFKTEALHTSGHASAVDIERLIALLQPKEVVPVHTMTPDAFKHLSRRTKLWCDGVPFEV